MLYIYYIYNIYQHLFECIHMHICVYINSAAELCSLSSMQPLLLEYTTRRRRQDATKGLRCPEDLCNQAAKNGLVVAQTLTDGRCGFDSFTQGLLEVATRDNRIRTTHNFKELFKLRHTVDDMLAHVRQKMVQWMAANKDVEMWEGLSFGQLALSMSHDKKTFAGVYLC